MKVSFWLGEEDFILTSWLDTPHNKNKCRLVTAAIEYYVENKSYICIGRVNPKMHESVCKTRSISVGQDSKAELWFKEYSRKHKHGATTKVKEILIRSIAVTDGEEYFPGKYEDLVPINGSIPEPRKILEMENSFTEIGAEKENEKAVKTPKPKKAPPKNDFMDDAITKMLGNGQNSMFNFG